MKKEKTFNIAKLAHILIILCIFTYVLIIGKNILMPLCFAALFSFMLIPLCKKIEAYISYRPVAIICSFIVAILPVAILITLFGIQFVDVCNNMDSISSKLQDGINDFTKTAGNFLGLTKRESEDIINDNASSIIQTPISYIGTTLSMSSTVILNFFLTFIYTFLLLLYRSSLKNFYIIQFGDQIKEGAEEVLERIESVIQNYLYGLLGVIAILGVLNTIGLMIIGIDYAFFWGFLAAFLAIIPYIGTIVGGLLPFIYAIATTDDYWQPIGVVILFAIVQFVEGNFITPKVVGSSIKLNPLVAIIALFVGGSIWGAMGLIIALPFMAILRIIFQQIDYLKPIGLLLSDELFQKDKVFKRKYDKERFRLSNFFKKNKPM